MRLSALSLKLIAIAAMVVDHIAFTFVPYGTPLWTVLLDLPLIFNRICEQNDNVKLILIGQDAVVNGSSTSPNLITTYYYRIKLSHCIDYTFITSC